MGDSGLGLVEQPTITIFASFLATPSNFPILKVGKVRIFLLETFPVAFGKNLGCLDTLQPRKQSLDGVGVLKCVWTVTGKLPSLCGLKAWSFDLVPSGLFGES